MAEAELLGLVDTTAGMMSARGNCWRMAFSAFCFRLELAALASKKFQKSSGTTGLFDRMCVCMFASAGLSNELGGAPNVTQRSLSGSSQLSYTKESSCCHVFLIKHTISTPAVVSTCAGESAHSHPACTANMTRLIGCGQLQHPSNDPGSMLGYGSRRPLTTDQESAGLVTEQPRQLLERELQETSSVVMHQCGCCHEQVQEST